MVSGAASTLPLMTARHAAVSLTGMDTTRTSASCVVSSMASFCFVSSTRRGMALGCPHANRTSAVCKEGNTGLVDLEAREDHGAA